MPAWRPEGPPLDREESATSQPADVPGEGEPGDFEPVATTSPPPVTEEVVGAEQAPVTSRRRRSWRYWTPCAWCRRRRRSRYPRASPVPRTAPAAALAAPLTEPEGVLARLPEARRRLDPATLPIAVDDFPGMGAQTWLQCMECGNYQPESLVFCTWCGHAVRSEALGPLPVLAMTSADSEGPPVDPKRRPRVSGTEWAVWLLVLVLFAAWFAFLSPWRVVVNEVAGHVVGQVRTWLDPQTGQVAGIRSVTSEDTLEGTRPRSLASIGSRSFWASAPRANAGVGATLRFYFDDTVVIDRLIIGPGIQNEVLSPRALATPHDISLIIPRRELPADDSSGLVVPLSLDELQTKRNLTQVISFDPVQTDRIALRIDSVYPSEYGRATSVAVTSVQFLREAYWFNRSAPTTADMPQVVLPPNVWVPPRVPIPGLDLSTS